MVPDGSPYPSLSLQIVSMSGENFLCSSINDFMAMREDVKDFLTIVLKP